MQSEIVVVSVAAIHPIKAFSAGRISFHSILSKFEIRIQSVYAMNLCSKYKQICSLYIYVYIVKCDDKSHSFLQTILRNVQASNFHSDLTFTQALLNTILDRVKANVTELDMDLGSVLAHSLSTPTESGILKEELQICI